MRILVTGGSGFIGTPTVKKLEEGGHEAVVYDLEEPQTEVTEFIEGDILDREHLFEAIEGCDAVINLAGRLGTAVSVPSPIPSVEVNVIGALNVFEACRDLDKGGLQAGVGNYFMNNPYSITRSTSVRFAQMANNEWDTEIAIVRGLNGYGPRQHHRPARKLCPNVVIPALLGRPITIFGDGEQIMDFIYVDDFAEVIVRAMVMDHGHFGDYMFEAAMGEDTTVNQFVEKIMEITGSDSKINYVPMRPGEEEDAVVKGDPSTLEPLDMGKEDLTSLDDGLKVTIDWYEEHLDEFPWDE